MAGLLNALAPRRKPSAIVNALRGQSAIDNAPVNSLAAPGGLLAVPPAPKRPSVMGGLLAASSVAPGIGDFTGPMADAHMYATDPSSRTPGNYAMSALGLLPFVPSLAGITAFHGSPHLFDNFDMSKIGTGEGAQAYGHGLYFAEAPEVAKDYQRAVTTQRLGLGKIADKPMSELTKAEQGALIELKLAGGDTAKAIDSLKRRGPDYAQLVAERLPILEEIAAGNKSAELAKGALYTVDIPDEAVAKMLDWDAPLSEQPEAVREALADYATIDGIKLTPEMTGKQIYDAFGAKAAKAKGYTPSEYGKVSKAAAEELRWAGVPGIKYLDAGSRGAGGGTRNFVTFDDKLPKILKRE